MADHGPAKGITRWLFTTNHKDIGTMYLIFSLIMFLIGGSMALVVRYPNLWHQVCSSFIPNFSTR